eukprot:GHVQ01019995.1.p1 GENE.GHVQ01019995.1~~GHVQ01019995.1.p1  ORF type:complete len:299 (+),score=52.75 GHVQ01019995.1:366-1262(+)
MGNTLSQDEVESVRTEVYSYYPGLEEQLEMAFSCHDIQDAKQLPFTTLEPVVRHLLMQYGLIEYLTRFSKTESISTDTGKVQGGGLDCSFVSAMLRDFGVRPYGYLDVEDFKCFTIVWLKKILDTYKDDQIEWSEKMRAQQEEQARKYEDAMKEFESHYLHQQAVYQQGLEEQQKQISDWNRALENAEMTQQQMYDSEMKRIEDEKRQAAAMDEMKDAQTELMLAYQQHLGDLNTGVEASLGDRGMCDRSPVPKTTNFMYPITATPYGACASAGAQEPTRRDKRREKTEKNKMFKNCC